MSVNIRLHGQTILCS